MNYFMKIAILNVISILVTIGWGVYLYMSALAGAYSRAGAYVSGTNPNKILLTVLIIATVASLFFSHMDIKRAMIWASAPVIIFIIGFLVVWIGNTKVNPDTSDENTAIEWDKTNIYKENSMTNKPVEGR